MLNDVIIGQGGGDTLFGGEGDDFLLAGSGNFNFDRVETTGQFDPATLTLAYASNTVKDYELAAEERQLDVQAFLQNKNIAYVQACMAA